MSEGQEKRPDNLDDIINDTEEIYVTRRSTQADLAKQLNERYGTHLTTKDIASVTQQEGYHHGIKKDETQSVMLVLGKATRDHLDNTDDHK